jgi:hypothetical protein
MKQKNFMVRAQLFLWILRKSWARTIGSGSSDSDSSRCAPPWRAVARTIIFLFLFLGCLETSLYSFEIASCGCGARIYGLGGSGVAQMSNPFGNFLNPAGLAGQASPSVGTAYLFLADEVSFKEINFNLPLDVGVFSFSYLQSSTDGVYHTVLDADGRPSVSDTFSYGNNFFALGFGRNFGNFSAGLNFKYSRETFGQYGNGRGYNADLGLIYPLGKNQNLGLVARNILPASLGAIRWSSGNLEKWPLRLVLGYSLRCEEIQLTADLNFSRVEPASFKAGVEWPLSEVLVLRGGVEQLTGYGMEAAFRITLGLGMRLGLFDFDYSYLTDPFGNNNFTHYFSFVFRLENFPARSAKDG